MTDSSIRVEGLTKAFGRTQALQGLDLEVPAGTVTALLGPNGAGKTTLVRILATLIRPDAGTARVAGLDVVRDAFAVRSLIGLTGQYAALDDPLTGRENLRLIGRLAHLGERRARARADELLELVGIADAGARPVSTYSGGMRRRLDIAAGLVAEPAVLFRDEPTTGLGPRLPLPGRGGGRGRRGRPPAGGAPAAGPSRRPPWQDFSPRLRGGAAAPEGGEGPEGGGPRPPSRPGPPPTPPFASCGASTT